MRILYFTAEWCGPCKTFKPIVQQVMSETGTNVQFIDVDQDKTTTSTYQVTSVPTIMMVNDNGIIAYRQSGVISKPQLTTLFNQFK
jgi:thioredoxin 1